MNRFRSVGLTTFLWLGCVAVVSAQEATPLLREMPGDAQGFVLVRGLNELKSKAEALSRRLGTPLPDLNAMLASVEKGLDKQRSLGVAWLAEREGDDPRAALRHFVFFIPVTNYADFVTQLGVEDASARISSGTLSGQPAVVARKGEYAIVAQADDKDSLEHVLNADGGLTEIAAPLAGWLDRNDVTVGLSPGGTQLVFAKIKAGLDMIKAGAASAGDGAQMVVASLEMYQAMFDAAEQEFAQLAVGLRVDPERSVAIHKRLVLKPGAGLAETAKDLRAPEAAWRGIPTGPFVGAFAGAMPSGGWSRAMMAQSFNIMKAMQSPDAEALSEEQLQQLGDLGVQSMQGVHAMSFAIGVGEPGGSMYSRTTAVLHVDDAQAYMRRYEATIGRMSELMREAKLPGAYDARKIQIGELSALQMTVDMSQFHFGAPNSGGPDMRRFHEAMFGPGGKMSIFIAPADQRAIAMAYTSTENLTRVIQAYRQGASGLADDAQVQRTARLVPATAQWIGFVSPPGVIQFVSRMVASLSPESDLDLPKFPASPPAGLAGELTASTFDAQLVVPVETLSALRQYVEATRQARR